MTVQSVPADPLVIGADVGGTKVRVLAADVAGRIVGDAREATEADVIAQITRLARALGGERLAGLGIGIPGSVDPATGIVSRIPNVAALEGVDLASRLSAALGVPVVAENDLSAAALAEAAEGTSAELVAVIAAGTGIGLGIVHDGTLLRGATGGAGEIADIPLLTGGTLEDVVSIAGIRCAYAVAGGDPVADLATILASASRGDADAVAAVDAYAAGLAHAVHVVRATLDPDRLVLTGGLSGSDVVIAALGRQLGDDGMAQLHFSAYGTDSPAHGALLLARLASTAVPGDAAPGTAG